MRWLRWHAEDHCPKPMPTERMAVVEIDEMWHFLGKLRQLW